MKNIKRAISILTAVVMLLTVIPLSAFAASNTTPFTDVGNDRWYTESVNFMYEHGYMSGTSTTTFSPNTTTTRAMFVTVLGRIAGINADDYKNTSTFNDVPRNWAEPYIAWAAQQGIVNGVGGNRFNPNGFITREQAALILYNYIKDQYDVSVNNTAVNNAPDKSKIDSWALTAMNWAMTNKIIAGDTDGSVRPRHSATRAELATILMRFCKYVDDLKSGTVDPDPTPTPPPVEPTPVPPCPDGNHVWVNDDPVKADLSNLHIDLVEENVREWIKLNDARVWTCPCGLNCNQWIADNYHKFDNAQDLVIELKFSGMDDGCAYRHNRTVTKNRDTIWPVKYDKHYTNFSTEALVIDQHCSKCGHQRSEIEPDLDINAPENWELHAKEEERMAVTVVEKFTETVGYNDENGVWNYSYDHGPYVNYVIKTATNLITGRTINLTAACEHKNWNRDWGDGSGYVGMRCDNCNLLVTMGESQFYE